MKKITVSCLVLVVLLITASWTMAAEVTIALQPASSVSNWPGNAYRWMDIVDNLYSESYQSSFLYGTTPSVALTYQNSATTFWGTLNAAGLKPNFAYQMKLVGKPTVDPQWGVNGDDWANEQIGYAGRWYQQAPSQGNRTDADYQARSPGDIYEGYIVFDWFVTDANGNAVVPFALDNSLHVLFRTKPLGAVGTAQPGANDAPPTYVNVNTFPTPAYGSTNTSYNDVGVWGQWELGRALPGYATLPAGTYNVQFMLTEESFHQSGLGGNWAGAMGSANVNFTITAPAYNDFITRNGTRLEWNGQQYTYVGVNFWGGMNLASTGVGGDRARLHRELDLLISKGVTNLRVMAGTEGPNSEPYRIKPALQTAPGVYDLVVLDGLDYLLKALKDHNMRAVMVLNNFWFWSGGMAQYVNWNGGGAIPYPGNWDTYQNYTATFYSNAGAKQDFRDHILFILNHVNPHTGLAYKDDATIMSWELGNEPRGRSNTTNFNTWIDSTAAYIKSLDSHHLVTSGCEGNSRWYTWDGLNFIQNNNGPCIDYTTLHIFVQNWLWYDPTNPSTYNAARDSALLYFNNHKTMTLTLGKPMVFEEFGLARDNGSFDPASATTYRNTFFTEMYNAVTGSSINGGPLVGDNIWAWGGEGRPVVPGGSWSLGNPIIGDPPHEAQGWYSVYDTDASTLAIFAAHAADLQVRLPAPTNLQASAVSNSQISLTWIDNSTGETGYKVERKTGAGGTFSVIATLAADVTSYQNTGLALNTTYYYRVRSYYKPTNSIYSDYSNTASAVITVGTIKGTVTPQNLGGGKTVNLRNSSNVIVASAVTPTTGSCTYSFANRVSGDYIVEIVVPSGWHVDQNFVPVALAGNQTDTVDFVLTAPSTLLLWQKDPSNWTQIIYNGTDGSMTYFSDCPAFDFVFNGRGLEPQRSYTLIYYPDPWPGNGLIALGSGAALDDGTLQIQDSIACPNLPQPYDPNANYYPFPCGVGAKIWLVWTEDLDLGGTLMDHHMTAWHPTGYLFENNTIHYVNDPSALQLVKKNTNWMVIPGTSGTLIYPEEAPWFNFTFDGAGLPANTAYKLIYYPDPYPGNGLIVLGSGTTTSTGSIHIEGCEPAGDLPKSYDANYSNGAKIWLVKSIHVYQSATNPMTNHLIGWQPSVYLFESNLIRYSVENGTQGSGDANLVVKVADLPTKYGLEQNFPNPFNPSTSIRFDLPEALLVNMTVYDLSGRLVTTLVNGWREAGSHEVNFDGSHLPSGIYIYRIKAGGWQASGKMVMVK